MIKLSLLKPANCDNCYGAICLPPKDAPLQHGKACFASGWGQTEDPLTLPDILQEVSVNIMSHGYCGDHMLFAWDINHVIEGREFCAGIPDENGDGLTDGGKDSCKGDSGGPLTCVFDDQPVLTGITSWGHDCAAEGNPGIYVDVAHYVDWIEETMQASEPTTPGFEELPEEIPEGLQCTKPFQRPSTVHDVAHRIVNGTVVEKGN